MMQTIQSPSSVLTVEIDSLLSELTFQLGIGWGNIWTEMPKNFCNYKLDASTAAPANVLSAMASSFQNSLGGYGSQFVPIDISQGYLIHNAGPTLSFAPVVKNADSGTFLFIQINDTPPITTSQFRPPALPSWFWNVVEQFQQNPDAAVYSLFDRIDSMLTAAKFDECDRILNAMPIWDLPTEIIGGMISITFAAHDKLRSRKEFFRRVYEVIRLRGEDAKGILAGLEGRNDSNAASIPVVG